VQLGAQMKRIRTALLGCTGIAAVAVLGASAAHASVDEYTAEGNQTVTLNLELCSAESQLAVRGDNGTDLDFLITDANGGQVYTDRGFDDFLSTVIEKDGDDCETFQLAVSNLGDESNTFAVIVEPITAASARIEKHIIQAGQAETINFKACGTSAELVARGNGESDVDFVVRNSDEGVVHENDDLTDQTTATLSALRSDCETFEMDLVNLGEAANPIMVVVTPEGVSEAPFAGTAPSTSLASVSAIDGGSEVQVREAVQADSSGAGEYRADANTSLLVDLPVCGTTRLEVRGDGDTDLDFTVTDSGGDTVHSDLDLSDVTFTTLEPSNECETFQISVANLGDVYNVFTVALIDPASLTGVSGAGQYRVNANSATKVALRLCEATRVSARGDGDTDLDFEVTDARGASVHSDYDMTDRTAFMLDPGNECASYQISVTNLGDVYNMLTVAFNGDAVDIETPAVAQSEMPIAAPDIASAEVIGIGEGRYRARQNGAVAIELPICESTWVSVIGDGDTDLDFEVRTPSGNSVHSDLDFTDQTKFFVSPPADCMTYRLDVANLGDVYNDFTIAFSDEEPQGISIGNADSFTASDMIVPDDSISPDEFNRNLVLLNRSGEVIETLFWSNAGVLGWGENQLSGGNALATDGDWNVNVFDGSAACLFDFKAVTATGREIAITGVNACDITSVTFE